MNPDMERLVKAAQRSTERQQAAGGPVSSETVIKAILEEMKTPTEPVNEAMLDAMRKAKPAPLNPVDVVVASSGFFGILAAYRGTAEDDHE